MKKKLLILLCILLAVAGVFCLLIQVNIREKKKSIEENKTPEMIEFDTKVKEMYGEAGYIGPMTEDIELLTEEELQKLNRDEEIRIDEEEGEIYGRFNKKKIMNAYDAREAAYQALNYIGIQPEKDAFLYVHESHSYHFQYSYKGVRVMGGVVHVILDDKNNTREVDYSIPQIEMDSVEPEYRGEKLEARLKERYGKCGLDNRKELWIRRRDGKYELEWDIYMGEALSFLIVRMNANTGEILSETIESGCF